MTTSSKDLIEEAACAVWRAITETEPTEPLRSKGGALDPSGYCLRLAMAVAGGLSLPPLYKNTPTTQDHPFAVAARAVLDAKDARS